MKKRLKKVFASILAVTVLATSVVVSPLTVRAEDGGDGEGTLSLDSKDRNYATGMDECYLQEIEEDASKNAPLAEKKREMALASYANEELPNAVDNSTNENKKYFPAVKSQERIGSCLFWADRYYNKTYMFNKYYDTEVSPETTFSPKWAFPNSVWLNGSLTEDRCPCTNFASATGMLGNDFYADCEADYMSAALSTTDAMLYFLFGKNANGREFKVDGPNSPDLLVIKKSLADGNIIQAGSYAYAFNYDYIDAKYSEENKKFNDERIIVACAISNGGEWGHHAMNIVGYDDDICVDLNKNGRIEEGEKGAFKLVNSWGDTWGNDGFIWMSYDAINKVSKYSKVGTGYGESRDYGLTYVADIILDDDRMYRYKNHIEPDYYYQITTESTEKGVCIKPVEYYGKAGFKTGESNLYYSYYSNSFVKGVNYRGERDKACETTFIAETRGENGVKIANGKGCESDFKVKKVVYVDNKNKAAYEIKLNENIVGAKSAIEIPANAEKTEIPYISGLEVSYDNNRVTAKAAASSSNGDITYSLSYESEKTKKTGTLEANTSGEFEFITENDGYYRVKITAKDKDGKENSKTKLIYSDTKPLNASIKSIDAGNPFSTVNLMIEGGEKPYTISYVCKKNKVEYDKVEDMPVEMNIDGSVSFRTNAYAYAENKGTYPISSYNKFGQTDIEIVVKDATGLTKKLEQRYTVYPFQVQNIGIKEEGPYYVNNEITFTADALYRFNGYTDPEALQYSWIIENKSSHETVELTTEGDQNTVSWTPEEIADYGLTVKVTDGNETVSNYFAFKVSEKKKTVVYYENDWDQAYIHFRTANGEWTEAPGEKMETSEIGRYKWKYEIDLANDGSESVEVCFNDGNSRWDSRNQSNYVLGEGTYGIKNEKIKELKDEDLVPGSNITSVYYNNNASCAYIHYKVDGGEWTEVPGVKMQDSNEVDGYRWRFDISLESAEGVTVCFNDGNNNWDSRNGVNYYLKSGVYGIKDGNISEID